jgi:hypothetical protein
MLKSKRRYICPDVEVLCIPWEKVGKSGGWTPRGLLPSPNNNLTDLHVNNLSAHFESVCGETQIVPSHSSSMLNIEHFKAVAQCFIHLNI